MSESGELILNPGGIEPGLLLGLLLVGAFCGAGAARFIHWPRVIGFLVAGLVVKYLVISVTVLQTDADWGESSAAVSAGSDALKGLTDLALGLILFNIGSVFETAHIRSVGGRALRISALEMGLTAVLVGVGCALVMITMQGWGPSNTLAMSLLLGLAAVATAPAATLLVLREYDAKGPMTDMVLTLTGINNIASIVLFHAVFMLLAWSGAIESRVDPERWLLLGLFFTTIGSALLGVALGIMLSWFYAKSGVNETLLVVLAAMLALGAGQSWLATHLHVSFNFLLTSLFAGAVFANVAINPDRLNTGLETVSVPIFAGFFALAGFNLHVADLARLGWIGVAYAICRIFGKVLGAYLGARWAAALATTKTFVGAALLCQAGVAIGLARFLHENWGSEQGGRFVPAEQASFFYTIILGSVVLFELAGPLLTKRAAVRAGEVKAIQLMRRRVLVGAEGVSISRLMIGSLLRALGLRRNAVGQVREGLKVEHIMRTNVKMIHAGDRFDDVMHFVERSRFNHFPVVDEDNVLVGVIHFADLRDILYDPAIRELITAGDLVDISAPLVEAGQSVQGLVDQLRKTDYGSFPVVDSKESRNVVGVVEQRDLLRVI